MDRVLLLRKGGGHTHLAAELDRRLEGLGLVLPPQPESVLSDDHAADLHVQQPS